MLCFCLRLGQCRKTTNFGEAKKCEKALFYAGFQHFAIHSNLLNFAHLTTVNPLRFRRQNTTEICETPTKQELLAQIYKSMTQLNCWFFDNRHRMILFLCLLRHNE